jgi:DNA invertase Pin-like site-specific DNA recombinase
MTTAKTIRNGNGKVQHVGYIRVSTDDQTTARQLPDLELDRIFEDKLSGKDTRRPALKEALAYVREGDTLHVHSIDRLARNLQDLLALLSDLTGRGVAVTFHKERLAFTGEKNAFQDLQLHIIGAVAEFERSLIRERQREGIAAAKKAGKHLGRRPKLSPEQAGEVRARAAQGAEKKELAAEYGISRQTLYALLAREQERTA